MDAKQSIGDYLVVFDLDGTLIDTDRSNNMAYQQAVSDITHQQINQDSVRLTRKAIQSLPNMDEQTKLKIVERKEMIYSKYLNLTSPLPGFFLLQHLNVPTIVLLTNARRKRAHMVLDYYNALSSFDKLYCKEDYLGLCKFEFLIYNQSINPDRVILFENEDRMIREANRYGIPMKNIFKA